MRDRTHTTLVVQRFRLERPEAVCGGHPNTFAYMRGTAYRILVALRAVSSAQGAACGAGTVKHTRTHAALSPARARAAILHQSGTRRHSGPSHTWQRNVVPAMIAACCPTLPCPALDSVPRTGGAAAETPVVPRGTSMPSRSLHRTQTVGTERNSGEGIDCHATCCTPAGWCRRPTPSRRRIRNPTPSASTLRGPVSPGADGRTAPPPRHLPPPAPTAARPPPPLRPARPHPLGSHRPRRRPLRPPGYPPPTFATCLIRPRPSPLALNVPCVRQAAHTIASTLPPRPNPKIPLPKAEIRQAAPYLPSPSSRLPCSPVPSTVLPSPSWTFPGYADITCIRQAAVPHPPAPAFFSRSPSPSQPHGPSPSATISPASASPPSTTGCPRTARRRRLGCTSSPTSRPRTSAATGTRSCTSSVVWDQDTPLVPSACMG